MLAVRTVEDVDRGLSELRNMIGESVRGSDRWLIAWERIDELLEERRRFTEEMVV
jgi:hypothetical protein